ncbi:MAG: alpha-L-fucosidase [Lentisphaerae bacterium]|nr:alpha-L-fucosidase [Lentisphaerota bacterium]
MRQKWFSETRFGLFIHWGIYSIPSKDCWHLHSSGMDRNEYEKFAEEFNPVDFNPEAWAELAWNAGMRYVVLPTKHHDGYCMFDSPNTDFKITNSPYGKDITAEFVAAFRKKGFKIGFYHSLVDWRHPHFIPDQEHPDWKKGERDFSGRKRPLYLKYLYEQVEFLLTNYGKIDLMFFDYTSRYKTSEEWEAEKLISLVYSLQPKIMVNDRLCYEKQPLIGDYCTPEITLPNRPVSVGGKAKDWETCMSINDCWGYSVADRNWKSVSTIIQALVHCTSMNGNLLLNIGPDAKGNIPQESVRILEDIGSWMKYASPSIHGAGKADMTAPYPHYYTQNGDRLFLHLTCPPMGDIILPEGNGKIKKARYLRDNSEIHIEFKWGTELLEKEELRIRPGFSPRDSVLNTIEIFT